MSTRPKISQNDLRKFMSQHKKKLLENTKRIESPLAKYLDDGTLKCILCDSIVRNETVWSIHINAKQHKENIARKKQQPLVEVSEVTLNSLISLNGKRHNLEPIKESAPPKKLKGILKNAPPLPASLVSGCSSSEGEDDSPQEPIPVKKDATQPEEVEDVEMKLVPPPSSESDLPEGFFDNPLLDAKARNVEYKDPIEEEWERFQKEIKEENTLSAQIIQDESEVATVERQIVEVDEQLKNWSRVLDLEKKKESLQTIVSLAQDIKKEDRSSSSEEEGLEEFVSWRTKKSFR